jgi:hypothetical protein
VGCRPQSRLRRPRAKWTSLDQELSSLIGVHPEGVLGGARFLARHTSRGSLRPRAVSSARQGLRSWIRSAGAGGRTGSLPETPLASGASAGAHEQVLECLVLGRDLEHPKLLRECRLEQLRHGLAPWYLDHQIIVL